MVPGKRDPRVRLSASAHGVSALALSVLLFSLGVYRGELSATIAGSALLVYMAFSLLSLALSARLSGNLSPRVSWADDGFFRVSGASAKRPEREIAASALSILGQILSRTEVVIAYAADPGQPSCGGFAISVPVLSGEGRHNPGPLPRGTYVPVSVRVRVSDFAGFVSLSRRANSVHSAEKLVIRPVPEPCRLPALPPGATGLTTGKSSLNRSDELHETRQYLPGDDPRRLNWKVYAHSGELSVREGELLPPPTSEYVFVFSEAFPPGAGKAERRRLQTAFDGLLSRASYLALRLLEERHVITVVSASGDGSFARQSFSRDGIHSGEALLGALSLPRLGDARYSAEEAIAASHPRAEILLFSLPQNVPSGLSRFSGRVRAFVGPLMTAREILPLPALARRLVFIDTAASRRRNTVTFDSVSVERACLSLFKEGLRADAI